MKNLKNTRAPRFEVQADRDIWLVGLACCPNEINGEKVVTVVRYFTQITSRKTLTAAVRVAERLNKVLDEERVV